MTPQAERQSSTLPPGRVVFVGAVHEARPALEALIEAGAEVVAIFTLDEARAAKTAGFVDLGEVARPHGIPVFPVANLNSPEAVERVRDQRPDLIVVVGWTRLLGEELLEMPERGCIGFHASMLPRHRGRAPVNWAILHGEREGGNTMMYLAPGADTGDIIDQRALPIGPDDTCADVYRKVGEAGAALLTEHIEGLLAGTAPRREQVHSEADLLPKRTPEMGITDWDLSPRQVHDWVRALTHPYPGAFTFLAGRKLTLWGSRMPEGDELRWEPEPGTLMGLEGDAVRVRAGGGCVLITRVQQQHEVEEGAADWFVRKGHRRGLRFDPADPALLRYARGLGPRPEDPQGGETR